jgi:uncharacterized protein YggU (UPF0235/DUF167 family)
MSNSNDAIVEKLQNVGLKLLNLQSNTETLNFCINVKAKPNSKKEGIAIGEAGELIVATRSLPIDGRANESISEALAELFGIAQRDIQLLRGERGKLKLFALSLHFRHNRDVAYYLKKLELWA